MKIPCAITLLTLLSAGCATSYKPCSMNADLDGLPAIRGDKECYQKRQKDGTYVNDGKFTQRHPNGMVAIEGVFREGRKDGTWTFYDPKGKKTAERYFENGVELTAPAHSPASQ